MRVTKSVEERKQEIMDTAMMLFTKKGYEQTTMRDIAKEVKVVPGLCYRYFPSKKQLFDETLKQYIEDYCSDLAKAVDISDDFQSALENTSKVYLAKAGKEKYHSFFHKEENKEFNILLTIGICEYMVPHVRLFLDRLNSCGKTNIENTVSMAQFALYGQIGIINDDNLSEELKLESIVKFLKILIKG